MSNQRIEEQLIRINQKRIDLEYQWEILLYKMYCLKTLIKINKLDLIVTLSLFALCGGFAYLIFQPGPNYIEQAMLWGVYALAWMVKYTCRRINLEIKKRLDNIK